jgi:formamidopyrimidine-DNA glycosylase
MPELPDIVVYIESMERFIGGQVLEKARVTYISLLRTYDPPLHHVEGKRITGFRRMGKRIVWELEATSSWSSI